jgi:hypothetical protein
MIPAGLIARLCAAGTPPRSYDKERGANQL